MDAVTGEPEIVVFSATNDGYLHAADGATGQELWSFIPRELLGNLADLYFDENVNFKNYGIDGDIIPLLADRNEDGKIEPGTDFAYLFFGLRRGGDTYFALDVTDKNAPKLKWTRTFNELGQTWSPPTAARIDVNSVDQTSPDKGVLIVGGGYDTVHDAAAHPSAPDVEGAGIMMLDIETGEQNWRAGMDSGADLTLSKMTRSIPGRVRVLDLTGDNYADRMYAADLGGQIWRFDISNAKTPANLVAGGVIGRFGAEGKSNPTPAETRRFYTTPDVSMVRDKTQDSRYLAISIGSGYRAHPLSNAAQDRFYSLRDYSVFRDLTQAQYDSYPIATDADMAEVSGQLNTIVPPSKRGWKFTVSPGEKILSDSATFNNSIYFVTFEPQVASADPCQAGLSVNRLYRVAAVNGDPPTVSETVDPNDPVEVDNERVTKLAQGGIAPKPQFLFPSPTTAGCTGEECRPPPLGCVGVECFDPGFSNSPVRTLWTQDGIE
jgi:type IV pilus assembly protein PilY1